MHKSQTLVPVIAGRCSFKELSSFNGSVAGSVTTNKRKGVGQRELQEESGKSKQKSIAVSTSKLGRKTNVFYVEVIKGMSTLHVILLE